MRTRSLVKPVVISAVIATILVSCIDYWVTESTQQQLYNDIKTLRGNKIGLLLGTSKTVKNGWENLFYKYRIEATVALFKAGKIQCVLISGDNSREAYNEPETMMHDLVAAGVPADKIFLDYAGFRTLDSIVRCKDIFGANDITIISQPFHNERALFLANHKGLHAIAFNAQDVPAKYGIRVALREKLARVKMLMDLWLGKQPKFAGPKVDMNNPQNAGTGVKQTEEKL
ncbi:SanA/YdcF family protein [Chitinophagaceae bacterium MMS25-I14]